MIRLTERRTWVSADSAQAVTDFGGTGSLLSTVFAVATGNPVEADCLRDLLGSSASILLNPPGAVAPADEQTWLVMRDLKAGSGSCASTHGERPVSL